MPDENRESIKKQNHVAPNASAPRAEAIVASLRAGEPSSDEVFEAFWQLDGLPEEEVREALAAWVGPLPDLDRLDAATRRAHGLPPRALRLRTLSVAKDADVLDAGTVAEEQLRAAGKTWDGADLAPEDRLDGELEGSFAGTLERHVLADAEATDDTPLFDVMLFGEDSGVVFAAGTSKVVALIAYGRVETRDRRTRVAIEGALASRGEPVVAHVRAPAPVETARDAAPAVHSVVEREAEVSAPPAPPPKGKVSAKKRASAKAPAKGAASKRAPAKKTAAKKAGAATRTSRVSAKKTAKKVSSKKTLKKAAAAKSARKSPTRAVATKAKSAKAPKTVKRAAATKAKVATKAKAKTKARKRA